MKAIYVPQTNRNGEIHFALTHEDALAAYVAIRAVYSQLCDEKRHGISGSLSPILGALYSYLYPKEA